MVDKNEAWKAIELWGATASQFQSKYNRLMLGQPISKKWKFVFSTWEKYTITGTISKTGD